MPFSFELLRPDDLLTLSIEARNLRLDTKDPKNPALVVEKPGKPAYIIIGFPPQSIAERAYFEATPPTPNETLDPPGSVTARLSGPSRLVFQLPNKLTRIPFNIQSLLDWSKYKLVVSTGAGLGKKDKPPAGLAITPPGALETALELPYRLILSPRANVGWSHAEIPVTHAGRTELWHTRMSRLVPSKRDKKKLLLREPTELQTIPLRAIWSPDFLDHKPLPPLGSEGPFRAAMSPRDRDQIVILTSGFNGYYVRGNHTQAPFTPTPAEASRIFLSALGGWLSLRGSWKQHPTYDTPDSGSFTLDLSEWVHLATEGRDHYVKIVSEGVLYPFGHRAARIKVTERKFIGDDEGVVSSPTAYLRQHEYIVVREPEKTYVSAPYQFQGLEMPLRNRVRIRTKVTPYIDDPATTMVPGATASFWVRVGGADFPFHLAGQDITAAEIDFITPLIFVSISETAAGLQSVQSGYAGSGARRACQVHSKKIAFADPNAGDTVLKTAALYFDTQPLNVQFPDVPFIPRLDANTAADVNIPAIAELLGTSPNITIHQYQPYLAAGALDANAGVFAEINNPPSVAFPADQGGGFATPKLSVTAISARKGLVGGAAMDAAFGLIDPAAFFGDISAQLFGTIPLQNLIPVDNITKKADANQNAPEIRSQVLPNHKNPQKVITRVHWAPALQDYSVGPVKLEFNSDGNQSELSLQASLQRSLDGSPPTSEVKGKLSSFLITLLGVIGLKISAITFASENGGKTIVKAQLPDKKPVQFIGPLSFVQTLADVLPPGIFGGAGPAIDLTSTAIRVTYTLGLPPISIGVFALENISIMTGLDLPYLDGKPGFEFAFAKRSRPFLLTVECLGGGGFVHVVLNADGIQMVEGALEFGGEFSIDLGVASGGVHVMAGIYFKLENTSTTLSGFVDIGGEVSVLGIISISIDLNLSLSYITTPQGSKVQGRATLTISVSILFFSISVSVSVERSFGSGSGDPRVHQLIAPHDWSNYAAAFA